MAALAKRLQRRGFALQRALKWPVGVCHLVPRFPPFRGDLHVTSFASAIDLHPFESAVFFLRIHRRWMTE